jgi:hypothetical protein
MQRRGLLVLLFVTGISRKHASWPSHSEIWFTNGDDAQEDPARTLASSAHTFLCGADTLRRSDEDLCMGPLATVQRV